MTRIAACLAWLSIVATACGNASPYTTGSASRDGIGKFYEGREIAQVMGHRGASWLERAGREREERTDLLINNLALAADASVADIGAGTGYFAIPLARRVPDGRVLAVDIQPEMLAIIEQRARIAKITNIERILASEADPGLPQGAVDLVLMVDAYHEFSHPFEVMQAVAESLNEGGRVVIVEYRGEDPSVMIKPLHKMTAAQVKREMAKVGLRWITTESYLPQQHVMTFKKR
ncbi:MAG: class I SAM-dependent methyltransferase [Pseudomonadota bacterium]